MRGRWLRTAGLALAVLLQAPMAQVRAQTQALPPAPPPPLRRVGVWLTNSPSPLYYDGARIERAVAELNAAGFNTLYPNVWSRGTTFHRSSHAPMEPALVQRAPELDPICRLARAAHRRGMQVIPWFEYGLMEPADAEVVQRNPDWLLARRDGSTTMELHGKPMAWLNPAHPQVRARFIALVSEIVRRCGLDGIQLDDHFAWPVQFGYDAFTRQLYRNDTGREPPDEFSDRAWMRWRRQQLTSLLRELRRSLPPPTVISLSPGPFRSAYNLWLQDWELWAIGKLIDDLVVQNYAYSVAGFARDLNQPALVKAKGWGMPVEIGILAGFGGRTPGMAVLEQKVQLSFARGYGVIYFYWEGLWGIHAGPEGGPARQAAFARLHGS